MPQAMKNMIIFSVRCQFVCIFKKNTVYSHNCPHPERGIANSRVMAKSGQMCRNRLLLSSVWGLANDSQHAKKKKFLCRNENNLESVLLSSAAVVCEVVSTELSYPLFLNSIQRRSVLPEFYSWQRFIKLDLDEHQESCDAERAPHIYPANLRVII